MIFSKLSGKTSKIFSSRLIFESMEFTLVSNIDLDKYISGISIEMACFAWLLAP